MNAVAAIGYSTEAIDEIMHHVFSEVSTGRSVSRILREDEGMPAAGQFWKWHFRDPIAQDKLARARMCGVEATLDEIEDIADESSSDVYIEYRGKDQDPVAKVDGDVIRRAALRIDTRIKRAQMIAPRKYGPKMDITSGGDKLPAAATDNRLQAIIAAVQQRKSAPAIDITPKETDDA